MTYWLCGYAGWATSNNPWTAAAVITALSAQQIVIATNATDAPRESGPLGDRSDEMRCCTSVPATASAAFGGAIAVPAPARPARAKVRATSLRSPVCSAATLSAQRSTATRTDWLRILSGLLTSIRYRRIDTSNERLAWLLIVATIPVGITGLLLEHTFRGVLAKPNPATVFLILNGLILLAAEQFRRAPEDKSTQTALSPEPVSPSAPFPGSTSQPAPAKTPSAAEITSAYARTSPTHGAATAVVIDERLAGLRMRDALVTGSPRSLP